MKVRNLTSRVQALPIVEIVGGRKYDIYVEGNGSVELCECYVPDIEKFKNVFELVRDVDLKTVELKIDEATQVSNEDDNLSSDDNMLSDDTNDAKDPEVLESKFICDICGAEFGSARGLNTHKNRVHLDEQ